MSKQSFRQQARQAPLSQTQAAAVSSRRFVWWHYLVVGVVIALLVWGWLFIRNPQLFPITTVKVEASYIHLEPQALADAIAPDASGDFFALNINRLQARILQLPWVADVVIHRVWPGTLVIKITEKLAVARWGESALLDSKGQIFTPAARTIPKDLPILAGPNIDAAIVLQQYQYISALLEPIGLKIASLELSARHAWHMTLTDGMQVAIGSLNVDQHIKHFVDVFPRLFANRINKVAVVDLRYPNGLAVSFQK